MGESLSKLHLKQAFKRAEISGREEEFVIRTVVILLLLFYAILPCVTSLCIQSFDCLPKQGSNQSNKGKTDS